MTSSRGEPGNVFDMPDRPSQGEINRGRRNGLPQEEREMWEAEMWEAANMEAEREQEKRQICKEKNGPLYGLESDETLRESVSGVIEAFLDSIDVANHNGFYRAAEGVAWPLKVYVYRRKTVLEQDKALNAGRVLARILDDLDEEYGDPDGDHTESTPAMMEAAKAFVETVCREYVPWACERTGEVVEVTRGEARKMVEG